jgi:hypothetical protein
MTHASVHRPGIARGRRSLALAGALVATLSAAHATDYDEVVQGDLSNDPAAPTSIGALAPGVNRISGTTIPGGTFDVDTHSYSDLDNDYVTFTVPAGDVLSHLVLGSDAIIQPSDRLFLGIAQGAAVSVDPSFTSAAGLLGWTLVGAPMAGSDLLPGLGSSAPPDFPAVGGATGFTGPLAAGQYTLWILDGDSPVAYDFRLDVTAVPEPSNWAILLAGLALTGLTLRRHARPR